MKKYAISLTLILCILAVAGCGNSADAIGEPEPAAVTEEVKQDCVSMVMVDGELYYDTGRESQLSDRCGVMDGEISSSVDSGEIPTKNNQSNFGAGYEYQRVEDGAIEVLMDNYWIVFEIQIKKGSEVVYHGETYDRSEISEETLEWLEWYNSLPEEERLKISAVPKEFIEDRGLA